MIEVTHLSKSYGKHQILKDISFQAECGECVVIVGRNGCGKSTLLQILAGIMKPDTGKISYFGNDAGKSQRVFMKYCGYVPQDNPLFDELTVRDNLKFWSAGEKADMADVIQQFKLQKILDIPVSKLSGGMKRRVSIASALLKKPPIVLLDEPTTALDIYYKGEIASWIKNYCRGNGCVIMTTHDEQEILNADRCFVMSDGVLIQLEQNKRDMTYIKKYFLKDN